MFFTYREVLYVNNNNSNFKNYIIGEEEVSTTTSNDVLIQTDCVSMSDIGIQTCVHFQHIQEYADEDLMDRNQMSRKLFLSSVLQDNNSCKFYTGMCMSFGTTECLQLK